MQSVVALEPTRLRLIHLLADLILCGHVLMAALWWWIMPRGFPLGHARFWANSVYPWVIIGLVVVAWSVMRGGRSLVLTAIAALWLAGAVSSRMTFPETFSLLWVVPLVIGAAFAAVCIGMEKIGGIKRRGLTMLFAGFGAVLGALFPMTQKAHAPNAQPSGADMPRYEASDQDTPIKAALGRRIGVYTRHGEVSMESGDAGLDVIPLLTFDSRSPDGCWTLLGPGFGTQGPIRKVIGMNSTERELRVSNQDEDLTTLEVRADESGKKVELVSRSRLTGSIWSHLNSFAELRFLARGRISITFSPCPNTPIDVLESDYPIGRPQRVSSLYDKPPDHDDGDQRWCTEVSGDFAGLGQPGRNAAFAHGWLGSAGECHRVFQSTDCGSNLHHACLDQRRSRI